MPKAAMDKDGCVVPWQDKVWSTWQVLSMQSEAKTRLVQRLAHCDFRFGISSTNRAHVARSGGFVVDVRHACVENGSVALRF